jgi:hypothetical protein
MVASPLRLAADRWRRRGDGEQQRGLAVFKSDEAFACVGRGAAKDECIFTHEAYAYERALYTCWRGSDGDSLSLSSVPVYGWICTRDGMSGYVKMGEFPAELARERGCWLQPTVSPMCVPSMLTAWMQIRERMA